MVGSLTIPRVTQGEVILLLGMHLGEVIQPLHKQKTLWAPLSYTAHQYRDKGTSEGYKPQLWLCVVIYHKLLTTARLPSLRG